MSEIEENDFSLLCDAFDRVGEDSGYRNRYLEKRRIWENSDFEWLVFQVSATKGAVFKKVAHQFLMQKGFSVRKSGDRQFDRYVNRIPVAIRGSTLWENGSYMFQQIKQHPYEVLICVGISPCAAHCWVIPKRVFFEGNAFRLDLEGFGAQHAPENVAERNRHKDTYWIAVPDPQNPPNWLRSYGGDLADRRDMDSLQEALRVFER